jgi:hypothetical protein
LVQLLVPYFKQGLENNDACLWLVGDLTIEEARDALAAVTPGLDHYIARTDANPALRLRTRTERRSLRANPLP